MKFLCAHDFTHFQLQYGKSCQFAADTNNAMVKNATNRTAWEKQTDRLAFSKQQSLL